MTPPPAQPDLHTFEHHWQDEADAAFLYGVLSDAEPDAKKKDLYLRLAKVEERHVTIWGDLLREAAGRPSPSAPAAARGCSRCSAAASARASSCRCCSRRKGAR